MEKNQLKNANGMPVGSQPLCGVYALALVSHEPVQRVFNKIKKTYYKGSNQWRGGTYKNQVLGTLEFYKRKVKKVEMKKRCTTATFSDYYAGKDKTYLLLVCGHWLTIHNGIVYDQSSYVPAESLKTKRETYEDTNKYGEEVTKYISFGKRNQIVKDAWEITNSKMSKSVKLLEE